MLALIQVSSDFTNKADKRTDIRIGREIVLMSEQHKSVRKIAELFGENHSSFLQVLATENSFRSKIQLEMGDLSKRNLHKIVRQERRLWLRDVTEAVNGGKDQTSVFAKGVTYMLHHGHHPISAVLNVCGR